MRNVLFAITTVAALSGCHRSRTPEERVEKINEVVTHKLDLSDQQSTKFKAITAQGLEIMKELQKQRESDLNWLIQQVTSDELDKQKLLSMYQNRRAVMDQQVPEIVDKLVEFHKSLSNDQKTELASKLKNLEEHIRER